MSTRKSARRALPRIGSAGRFAWAAPALCAALAASIGLAASAAPCGAVTIRGTSSTAAYVQEASSEPFGTDLENRTRVFERLRFDVLELGAPELTFHGFLTARNDVTNQSIGDTRTRLYHGFLQYRTIPASGESTLRYDLRLGRVWVPAGIGTGTVDGAYARIERPGWGTLAIFGGTLGADAREQWRFDEPDESARIGGELRLRPNLATSFSPEVGVSYALTRRHDEDENSRIGAKATLWVQRQLRIWTEFRHDFLLDETYGQAAGVEYLNRNNGLRLWGEYNRRTPQLPATSFFAFWDTREVSELRGGGGINLFGPYRISADFLRTDFRRPHVGDGLSSGSDVDRAKSIRLVLGRGAYQIGARFESGFGGDRTGLVLAGSQQIGDRLRLDGSFGYETYDYGDREDEDNDASTTIFAATYQALRDTRIVLQVEGLTNWDLEQDIRLLARIDQRFRLGL